MKNLRHLFRRSGWQRSDTRRRRPQSSRRRRLIRSEALEKRQLLAGDIALAHNYVNSLDVDDNYALTARDALIVVNHLNQHGSGQTIAEFDESMNYVDVNGDGMVTTVDALRVINGLQAGEGIDESLELVLGVRDKDDGEIMPDGNGEFNVTVGEVFNLELAYQDLRDNFDRLGVAKFIADIGVNQEDVIVPAVTETQRFGFDGAFIDEDSSGGTITFSLEGQSQEVPVSLADFLGGRDAPATETKNALVALGYSEEEIETKFFNFRNTDDSQVPDDSPEVFVQIRYVGEDNIFKNLPKIEVKVEGASQDYNPDIVEFNPLNDDPEQTINSNAVPFIIDANSRTFACPICGLTGDYYDSLPTGGYSETGGFDDLGGTNFDGPPNESPIFEADLREVFDAISIPVIIREPVQDLVLTLNPANDEEAVEGIIVWRDDDQLPLDKILVDEDGSVTINATSSNQNPVPGAPVQASFNEDDAPGSVNLVAGATDPDLDPVNVTAGSLNITSGDGSGIVLDAANNELDVTPNAYNALNDGQTETIQFSYQINDGQGGTATNTGTITIIGANEVDPNQNPVPGAPVQGSFNEDDAPGSVNLVAGATDPDLDPVNVTAGSLNIISGDGSGIVLDAANNELDVTPNAYNALNDGQTETIQFSYQINDGQGGTATNTGTITIIGANEVDPNQNPVPGAPVQASFNEDDAPGSVNLVAGATDPDLDPVNVTAGSLNITSGDGSGIVLDAANNELDVTPNAYNALNTGQTETIQFSYQINDGQGGTATNTGTITIIGADEVIPNRNPVPGAPVQASFNEDDAPGSVNLVAGATDPDLDPVNVTAGSLNITSGDGSGIVLDAANNELDVTPNAYNALNTGQTETIQFSYQINDGQGGTATNTGTITIIGANEVDPNQNPVPGAPVQASFNEDDAPGSVNLVAGATDPDLDPVNVTAGSLNITSGDGSGIVLDAANNELDVTPNAYNALNDGQTETIQFSYQINDGRGGTATNTGTIIITGTTDPFAPSIVFGSLFVDLIENIDDFLPPENAAPFRDGVKDVDEAGLAGIAVHLIPKGSTGGQTRTDYTDLSGDYLFTQVAPGIYDVVYDLPGDVAYSGGTVTPITIGAAGGESKSGGNVGAIGLRGGLTSLDILASSYLRAKPLIAALSDGGLQGGSVALTTDGVQELFKAAGGFDGCDFAELTLNDARDAALLTIVEDGEAKTARLSEDYFQVSRDGTAVQFFGGKEDFDFFDTLPDSVTDQFDHFGEAIDKFFQDV